MVMLGYGEGIYLLEIILLRLLPLRLVRYTSPLLDAQTPPSRLNPCPRRRLRDAVEAGDVLSLRERGSAGDDSHGCSEGYTLRCHCVVVCYVL